MRYDSAAQRAEWKLGSYTRLGSHRGEVEGQQLSSHRYHLVGRLRVKTCIGWKMEHVSVRVRDLLDTKWCANLMWPRVKPDMYVQCRM